MSTSESDISEVIADRVAAVSGVAGLHGGMFGEAATYLPRRRVAGIRSTAAGTEVHVSLLFGSQVRDTAEAIRGAVAALVPGPIHVVIEDIVDPHRTGRAEP